MKYEHAPIPNIAAIHDMASWGRCSLSVVIPVLSAMGYQVTPLPTALLSTHTGGFEGFTFLDLTEQMEQTAAHWQKLAIPFRGIYSGFLGSGEQIDTVSRFIDTFRREQTLVLVDPVLGDDGDYYATCGDALCRGMRSLCAKADIICPNVTEACLLLGVSPKEFDDTERGYGELLHGLQALGPETVVITGYEPKERPGEIGVIYTDGGSIGTHTAPKCKTSYPGTGELFASVLLGRLLRGESLDTAAAGTVGYVAAVIADSAQYDYPTREGVLLERHLGELTQNLK